VAPRIVRGSDIERIVVGDVTPRIVRSSDIGRIAVGDVLSRNVENGAARHTLLILPLLFS